jgi:hypothetical protein
VSTGSFEAGHSLRDGVFGRRPRAETEEAVIAVVAAIGNLKHHAVQDQFFGFLSEAALGIGAPAIGAWGQWFFG